MLAKDSPVVVESQRGERAVLALLSRNRNLLAGAGTGYVVPGCAYLLYAPTETTLCQEPPDQLASN